MKKIKSRWSSSGSWNMKTNKNVDTSEPTNAKTDVRRVVRPGVSAYELKLLTRKSEVEEQKHESCGERKRKLSVLSDTKSKNKKLRGSETDITDNSKTDGTTTDVKGLGISSSETNCNSTKRISAKKRKNRKKHKPQRNSNYTKSQYAVTTGSDISDSDRFILSGSIFDHSDNFKLGESSQMSMNAEGHQLTGNDKRKLSNTGYNLFNIAHDSVIMVVQQKCNISYEGKATIQCLLGSAEIYGFSLRADGIQYPLYSPVSHNLVTLEVQDTIDDTSTVSEICRRAVPTIDSVTLNKISRCSRSSFAVLLLKPLGPDFCDLLSNMNLYRRLFNLNPVSGNPAFINVIEGAENATNIPPDYQSVASEFMYAAMQGRNPVIAVCGGKNYGKSVLARYLINRTLSCVPSVAYLECDIGQTEFIPSGCVGLNIITTPVLVNVVVGVRKGIPPPKTCSIIPMNRQLPDGPPFTHPRDAISMSFVGNTSPGECPLRYVRCLQHVYSAYAKMSPRCPLIVNTMGWPQGLGLTLLVSALRLTQPDILVQLDGVVRLSNFPRMSASFVSDFPVSTLTDSAEGSNVVNYSLYQIPSQATVHSKLQQSRFSPSDLRNLMLLSYFGKKTFSDRLPGMGQTCLSIPVHSTSFKSVAIHAQLPEIDSFINSVCSLCSIDEELIPKSDRRKYLKNMPVCESLGLGIVRAIDVDEDTLCVSTPVDESTVEKVNCLLVGSVDTPIQLLSNAMHADIFGGMRTAQPRGPHLQRKRPSC